MNAVPAVWFVTADGGRLLLVIAGRGSSEVSQNAKCVLFCSVRHLLPLSMRRVCCPVRYGTYCLSGCEVCAGPIRHILSLGMRNVYCPILYGT